MAKTKTEIRADFIANTEQFTTGIKKCNQEIKGLTNELRTNATKLKGNATDTNLLKERLGLLQSELTQNQSKQQLLNSKLEEAKRIYGEDSDEVFKLKQELERAKNQEAAIQNDITKTNTTLEQQEEALKGTNEEVKETVSAYDQLKSTIGEQESKLKSLTLEYQNLQRAGNGESQEAKDLKSTIDGLNTELNENKSKLKEVDGALEEVKEETRSANDGFTVFKGALANLASSGFQMAIDKAKEFGKSVVETGMNYEVSMSQVKAVSGATNDEIAKMDEKAKTLGKTTKFTASEVADGFYYMSLAGWDTQESLDGIDGVLSLASASGMDLSRTSDILTDNLSAFGMEAKDSTRLADAMAYAMSHSNTNVEQLGEAYKNCAATSTQLGYSFEDTTSALMIMANSGIKGGEAGTALSSIMSRLGNNTSGCRDVLAQYGVEVYDSNGKVRDLSSILGDMQGIWGTLTDEQKANLSQTVAGKTAQSELMTVLGASEGTFQNYKDGLNSCNGAAKKMSDTMQDNLQGDVIELSSSFDGFKQKLYEDIKPALEAVVGGLKAFSDWCNNNTGTIEAIAGVIGILAVSWGLVNGVIGIYNVIMPIYTAVTTGASLATTALGGAIAFLTSPVTIAIGIIAGLIAVGYLLWQNWDAVCAKLKEIWDKIKTDVSESFNNVKQSIEECWNNVKAKTEEIWNGITSFVSGIWNGIKTTATSVWNGIKSGIEGVINGIKNSISNVFNGIQTTVTGIWNGIKSVTTSVWNGIKSAIESPVKLAYNTVNGVVSKLKSVFNFKWKLPELKLPHISVSGGKAPFGIAGMGSLPKFSIKWYAKGGILTKPTLFATDGQTAHVGGEAGDEAVLPIDLLDDKIKNSMLQIIDDRLSNVSNTTDDRIGEVIDLLHDIKDRGLNAYFNGRKVSEELGDTNDIVSGRRSMLNERGLAY